MKVVGNKILPYIRDAANSTQASRVYDTIEKVNKNIEERADVFSYGGVRSKASRENIRRSIPVSNPPKTVHDEQHPDINENETRLVVRRQNFAEKCTSRVKNAFAINSCNPFNVHQVDFSAMLRNVRSNNSLMGFLVREVFDSVSARISDFFAESETASCIRLLKSYDPNFDTVTFLKLARDLLIPNIIEAILCRDLPSLKTMCSEAAYNLISASSTRDVQYRGELLDIRNVELIAGKVIDNNPILVLSLHAQQVSFATAPDGSIVEGEKNRISHVQYILALSLRESKPSEWILVDISFKENSY